MKYSTHINFILIYTTFLDTLDQNFGVTGARKCVNFLYHYSDFWYYRSLLYQKISWKNKNKLRTIYLKNHENFKNSKPRVKFYGYYKKIYKRKIYNLSNAMDEFAINF